MYAFLLLTLLTGFAGPAPQADSASPPSLSLEEIFKGSAFRSSLPSGITWMPDGKSFLYRERVGETTFLREHDVASGGVKDLLDWGVVQEDLKAMRPGREKPAMDDTNRTGRFSFPPILSPDGDRMVGTLKSDLYLVELGSGEVRFLTNDTAEEIFFRFRPDGRAVSFARDGDLYQVSLVDWKERRLTNREGNPTVLNGVADWVYEEELGLQQAFWWAPDASRVAYLQFDTAPISIVPITDELSLIPALERQRYPKAGEANARVRLGILDLTSGETHWVASGDAPEAYIVDVGWVKGADGNALWYLWLNRDQTRLELRLVEEGGATRTLLVEEEARWVAVGPDPTFLPDGSFLWTSERDGWRHIYRYGLDGKLIARLTKGEWEVKGIDGLIGDEAVLFTSTEASAIERQAYRVDLDGTDRRRVTHTPGWHAIDPAPGGKVFLDRWSTSEMPTRIDLASSGEGDRLRTIDDGAIPALGTLELARSEFELVELDDETSVWTRTLKPVDFDPNRRYPVIVYVYGGPGAQLVRNAWGGSRGLYQQYLCRAGAVIFTLDNRGSGGRGRDFARLLHRRLGSLEVEDQTRGVDWLRKKPWVDGERIGIYGGSYGGFMTLNCLMRSPDHFKAGVSYAPVTDFRLYDTIYTERYMDTPAVNAAGYTEGAPLSYAEGLKGALLLVHGSMDNNVHFQNSVQLMDRLAKAQKPFELMVYPRTRHGMRDSDYRLHFHRLSAEFFARELGLRPGP